MPRPDNLDIVAQILYQQFYGEPMDEYVDEKERAFWRRKAQNHLTEFQARLEHCLIPDDSLAYDRMSQLHTAKDDIHDTTFRRGRGKSVLGVDGKRVFYPDVD